MYYEDVLRTLFSCVCVCRCACVCVCIIHLPHRIVCFQQRNLSTLHRLEFLRLESKKVASVKLWKAMVEVTDRTTAERAVLSIPGGGASRKQTSRDACIVMCTRP